MAIDKYFPHRKKPQSVKTHSSKGVVVVRSTPSGYVVSHSWCDYDFTRRDEAYRLFKSLTSGLGSAKKRPRCRVRDTPVRR